MGAALVAILPDNCHLSSLFISLYSSTVSVHSELVLRRHPNKVKSCRYIYFAEHRWVKR